MRKGGPSGAIPDAQPTEPKAPRGRSRFRESDVKRAIKAAKAAGVEVGRIEIAPDGRIVVTALDKSVEGAKNDQTNELDDWLKRRAHSS